MGFLDDLEVDMVNSCDLRSLFRSSLAHFPPQDQQHAIQYDLLLSLLNLLAATTSDPGHQRPPSSPRSLSIDDMDDDELFFHVLHQELTSVNRHFEECAAGIVAQWASHGEGSLESPPLAESSSANDAPASTQEQYVRRAWTIAQAAKWCWQFARINAIAALCLVRKRDEIRNDCAGMLFLNTEAGRCKFLGCPMLLELQSIAALRHVEACDGTCCAADTSCGEYHLLVPSSPAAPASPSAWSMGDSSTDSLSRADSAGLTGVFDGAHTMEAFLCQPTCRGVPGHCMLCQETLHSAIGLTCGCVLCGHCAVRQLAQDATGLYAPLHHGRGMQRLRAAAAEQRRRMSEWLSPQNAAEVHDAEDALCKHVQQAMALQACPCCKKPSVFRECTPLPALSMLVRKTSASTTVAPPPDIPPNVYNAVYHVAFSGMPLGGCGTTQRGCALGAVPAWMRKAAGGHPGFVRARAVQRWRGVGGWENGAPVE